MKQPLITSLVSSVLLTYAGTSFAAQPLEEVMVTAELIDKSVLELPNSVTVVSSAQIEQRNAQHLEDILNLAPNVNFATGASRGRFIQIRGIGERSEFQDPIINSVGVVVDGIDLTGIATAASTLDVDQIEILRGPQGTLFGANALAGLINVVSNKPSDEFAANVSVGLEDFGGQQLSGFISGPSSATSGYRLAVKQYSSDGFTNNVFLGRDDVSAIDETTARLRFISEVSQDLNIDMSVFLADIDNGYDAFSLDNNRDTYSDEPGFDRQETRAASIRADYQLNDTLHIEALASVANSVLEYSYDEDWSHLGICDNTACDSELFGFDWFYSSFDQYTRDNDNTSIDLKLVSQGTILSWVAGLYHRDQSIDLLRDYTYNDGPFTSAFDTRNSAVYGQLNLALNDQWSLITGLRSERRDVEYTDSNGANAAPDESLWGGRVALEYRADSGAFVYGLVSRGFKPGGFNLDQDLVGDRREFDTETMVNYELGFKHALYDDRLQVQAALFYQDRDAIQTKQSIVSSIATGEVGGACPCGFTDFTDNAASGSNKGIELELNWAASDAVSLYTTVGLLDTEFDELLTFDHVNADLENGIPYNLDGREQAHAPAYQVVIGGQVSLSDAWTIGGSIEAKDDFYFSDRHEARSDAYELLNLELTYRAENWELALYGKNLTDELVKTRGFGSFGNDPRKFYETEPYNQFGTPRLVGVRASFDF
ncbi:TonB-dependent receptor [Arenicella xantha]|uniref:Outer membrane receptor protein involved in Fe transport n=1 Tax=Arenicella xantha TaxID=644221 RepID=A0A395JQ01_9GAMM|nr:TonB-dependent receptor [Arenicella xantha]RBP53689.1 outer membrane receptor protein involved in Fe transport [Arenicella xantha]